MKGSIFVVGFIVYNIIILQIKNHMILSMLIVMLLAILIFLLKGSWHTKIRFLFRSSGFIFFVILCNLFFSNLGQALLIGMGLESVTIITYIISRLLSFHELAQGIVKICLPLKYFHINIDEITLCIIIALTFVTLFVKEAETLQNNLRLKGCNFWTCIRHPQIYITSFIGDLFKTVEIATQVLRLKGYE